MTVGNRKMTTKKKDVVGDEQEKMTDAAEKELPVCFVIMPIADMPGYDTGHFGRVYEHLLKPAIKAAGYNPVRADDTNKTDYIVVGIIQKIVESDMVVCDLSGRNANVMYELGIRHAFNKNVVLIKDSRTEKVFDIQGLRYTQYDESLRIDSVQKDTARIEMSITETAKSESRDLNSIVKLAGIHAAEAPRKTEISTDTQIILSAIQSIESRMGQIERSQTPSMPLPPPLIATRTGAAMTLGTKIFSKNLNIKGTVNSINTKTGIITIVSEDGGITGINMNSENFKEFEIARN